jgi:hypothetical protein
VIGWKVLGRAEWATLARLRARASNAALRQWLRVWRWPAGLVAGLVLWVALVAVVGAAPRAGKIPACHHSNVINLVYSSNLGVGPTASSSTHLTSIERIDCRPGLPPRP